MEESISDMKQFISKNTGSDVSESNVDDFVFASKDGVSEMLLEIMAKEQATEDILEMVKSYYRKKTITLGQYLETVREQSEEQFYNLAMKRKVLALLKQSS